MNTLSRLCLLLAGMATLASCDSTPRERQAAVRDELHELDSTAHDVRHSLKRVAHGVSRLDSANRARKRQPFDSTQQKAMAQTLLGPYATILRQMTGGTIADAYGQLLRQTRARHEQWTARDWDYAVSVYRQLNEQLKRVRLDLPARDELRIRAWQAEFKSLQAKRSVNELQALTREEKAGRN